MESVVQGLVSVGTRKKTGWKQVNKASERDWWRKQTVAVKGKRLEMCS